MRISPETRELFANHFSPMLTVSGPVIGATGWLLQHHAQEMIDARGRMVREDLSTECSKAAPDFKNQCLENVRITAGAYMEKIEAPQLWKEYHGDVGATLIATALPLFLAGISIKLYDSLFWRRNTFAKFIRSARRFR